MSHLAKNSAENQKDMLDLIAPTSKKPVNLQNAENSDSEKENNSPITTSTPPKSKTTTHKHTPIFSRNKCYDFI